MSTLTQKLQETISFSSWTHPTTGETRHYVNAKTWEARKQLPYLLNGINATFYNSGNVSSAEQWNDETQEWEHLSNTAANREQAGKVYYQDGTVYGTENPAVITTITTLFENNKGENK